MASTYLTRTFAQAGNRRTFTISYWVKMGYVSTTADGAIFDAAADGSNSDDLYIHTGRLNFSGYYGGTQYIVRTSAKYRDLSGWYHHVVRFDTTQATASDRLRLYVNGELQTALDNNTYPSQNFETTYMNTARKHTIGSLAFNEPDLPFNGSMSHFHFCDGQSYAPTEFGEYDANGVWKINTSPSVTYGTNGFFILKNGNSVTDQSGNGNNWTVAGGTLTNTEDCPSNVFATMNPLFTGSNNFTFENGNTTVTTSVSDYKYAISTLGMSSGKYYFEVKNVNHPSNPNNDHYNRIGIASGGTVPSSSQYLGVGAYEYGIREDNGNVSNNNGSTAYGIGYSTDGDIVGCALDLDNNKIYWSKNGTWMASADPSAGTNGFSITAPANTDSGFYHFAVGEGGSSLSSKFSINFGNGYFGTTPVASAGTNTSGIGIFEYDVPTGYTALSTKGLNL
jgi:hypothetical protein